MKKLKKSVMITACVGIAILFGGSLYFFNQKKVEKTTCKGYVNGMDVDIVLKTNKQNEVQYFELNKITPVDAFVLEENHTLQQQLEIVAKDFEKFPSVSYTYEIKGENLNEQIIYHISKMSRQELVETGLIQEDVGQAIQLEQTVQNFKTQGLNCQ